MQVRITGVFMKRSFLFLVLANAASFSLIGKEKDKGIHENGYWFGDNIDEMHCFDPSLANALTRFFKLEKARSIVDFGCGKADYVKNFLRNDLSCEGYDGNPDTPKLSKGLAKVADLSAPFDLGKKYDWVISLEVGEHLPKQFERTFIENLDRHCKKGIVLSWAVKGQGGFGHFNEQNNDYIKNIMTQYGYANDIDAENTLRKSSKLWWFKSTVMVFRKNKKK